MEYGVSTEREYELNIEGHRIRATLELGYVVECDPAHEADADGLRGVTRWGARCESVTVRDGAGRDITLNLYACRPVHFRQILDLADSDEMIDWAVQEVRL